MKFSTAATALAAISAVPAALGQGIFVVSPQTNAPIDSNADSFNLTIAHYSYSQNIQYVAAQIVAIDPARPQVPTYVGAAVLDGTPEQIAIPGGGSGQGVSVEVAIKNKNLPVGPVTFNITAFTLVGVTLEQWPQYANVTVNISNGTSTSSGSSGTTTTSASGASSSDSDSSARREKRALEFGSN